MIDHRGNAVVGRDRQKLRLELFALADVDRKDLVGKPGLFEEHRDLVAVRRSPVMKVDHRTIPSCLLSITLSQRTCDCMKFICRTAAKSMAGGRASRRVDLR